MHNPTLHCGDPHRLPVLRVLVVRVTGALVLQVGVVVAGGGVGVVAVLVDLIQAPDEIKDISSIHRFLLMWYEPWSLVLMMSTFTLAIWQNIQTIWLDSAKERAKQTDLSFSVRMRTPPWQLMISSTTWHTSNTSSQNNWFMTKVLHQIISFYVISHYVSSLVFFCKRNAVFFTTYFQLRSLIEDPAVKLQTSCTGISH